VNHLGPDQAEEVDVVPAANAVVKPQTVVVKVTCASVALAAVLGLGLNVALAPLAVLLELVLRELFVLFLAHPFNPDDWVTGVDPAAE